MIATTSQYLVSDFSYAPLIAVDKQRGLSFKNLNGGRTKMATKKKAKKAAKKKK